MFEICPNCNSKVRKGAKFCEVCGKNISGAEGKKTLDEIEQEIRAKVEVEFNKKHEMEFRKQRERELRKEKQRELKNSRKSIFDSGILLVSVAAVLISIFLNILVKMAGYFNFNEFIKVKGTGDGNSYWSKSGFPLRFLNISNMPTTDYMTIVSYDYVYLILDFILYAVCLTIFLYGVLLVWKKIKK